MRYVIRCGSNNGIKKVVCLKEVGLYAQNMTTSLGSKIGVFFLGAKGDMFDHLTLKGHMLSWYHTQNPF